MSSGKGMNFIRCTLVRCSHQTSVPDEFYCLRLGRLNLMLNVLLQLSIWRQNAVIQYSVCPWNNKAKWHTSCFYFKMQNVLVPTSCPVWYKKKSVLTFWTALDPCDLPYVSAEENRKRTQSCSVDGNIKTCVHLKWKKNLKAPRGVNFWSLHIKTVFINLFSMKIKSKENQNTAEEAKINNRLWNVLH